MQRIKQMGLKRIVLGLIAAVVVIGVLIQLVPVDRTNPAMGQEPNWAAAPAGTRDLVKAACFDCHSNETKWPWYSKIAPVSWLIAHDVDEGRAELNFSEWYEADEVDEIAEAVDEGEMPPWYYVLMHSEADLSDSDKQLLIDGIRAAAVPAGATGASPALGDDNGDDNDDDD